MSHIISMFIDDELSLNDKIEFVNRVREDRAFKEKTVELLEQEKWIRSDVTDWAPAVETPVKRRFASFRFPRVPWRPAAALGFGLAMVTAMFIFYFSPEMPTATPYRFIIYQPNISRAEITGSFTQWRNLAMKKAGNQGYWEIILNISPGEHRFTYIVDGGRRLLDPTLPGRETDDFGGENTILSL